MPGIIHYPRFVNHDRGVVLLMVLMIVMAISVISLGFIARADIQLACSTNADMRVQMDQLADSALEHGKGLILHPQDVNDIENWRAAAQQLAAETTDYYDVNVARDDSNPGEYRNYVITCEAYRQKTVQGQLIKTGRSRLTAELRLDPCIGLWIGADAVVQPKHVLQCDLYGAGTVLNLGTININGDVFANTLTGTIAGRHEPATDLSLAWPPVTSTYANADYPSGSILSDTLSAAAYQPARVWRRTGDLIIDNTVMIQGMLLVEGNLTIRGNSNLITAAKNLPALYVSGNLTIEDINDLRIEGLAVVDGTVRIGAGASNVHILGGLFVKETIRETASDSSGGNDDCTVYGAPTWRPLGGARQGALEFGGASDYLRTQDSPSLQLTNDYTISVWLKPASSQNAPAGIVAKTDATGSTDHWALQFDTATSMELTMYHGAASWQTGITLAHLTAQDRWYHVAVVRDANTMSSYRDGAEVRRETWDIGPGSGNGHLNIAADRTGLSSRLYAGLIDDLRVYNQAVALPPPDGVPSLIGHWKLDESGSEVSIVAAPARSAIVSWGTSEEHWSPAVGAFYRSIRRH